MIRGRLALVIVAVACTEARSANTSGDDAIAGKLVGAWDATMTLDRSYPLQPHSSEARTICGTISVIENRTKNASAEEVVSATQLGVYDLPLSRIGLEWNDKASFPTAVVNTVSTSSYASSTGATDSVRIVLNPGREERIVLSGRYEPSRIQGVWTAQSARGTANGSFSMRPHISANVARRSCPSS
jgi:hypothetical protein